MPRGRMIDPELGDFWVSWQDDRALENETVRGAEAAIAWGRERSSVVMIRLGHTSDTYFSAGDEHPSDDGNDELPRWPPAGPPAEGWWQPPPPPTRIEVASIAASVAGGETTPADAAAWVEERLLVFGARLPVELQKALVRLQEELAAR